MKNRIKGCDLFSGGGGTSTGAIEAVHESGRTIDLTAINHWPRAIETHAANHPEVRHICQDIEDVDPNKVCGRKIDILVASPECRAHSYAKGGTAIDDQSRSTAWEVVRWAQATKPDQIVVENVKQFADWTPLDRRGKPIKSRRGETFQTWIQALRDAGYQVEWRVLCAADYGAATARYRLFIRAARGRRPIRWPSPTHSQDGQNLPRWRPARDVIDFSYPSQSIFARKKPLAPNTLRRIEAGIRKFWGDQAEPFLIILRRHMDGQPLDGPLPTICASGNHVGLVQPFFCLMNYTKSREHDRRYTPDIDQPVRTVTAQGNRFGLVEPFIVPQLSGAVPRGVDRPLNTITSTSRGIGLLQPFQVVVNHQGWDEGRVRDLDQQIQGLTAKNGQGLVEPIVVDLARPRSGGHTYASGQPMPTVTSGDTQGVVQAVGIDIHFRMLQPSELAAAMSFPRNYKFIGTREDVVKMIGNAVEVKNAKALCGAALAS